MSSDFDVERNTAGRSPALGACWIAYGIIRLIAAFVMFFYSATATVMFGALLNRVANPFALMDIFHVVYGGAIVLAIACGIFGIMAGLALMSGQHSARPLGLIAAVLSLSNIPLGTTLGICTLVILLPARVSSTAGAREHLRPVAQARNYQT
jgi:hypothetical protein